MKNWITILTFLVGVETFLIILYICGEMEVDGNSPSVLISALGVIITFVVAWQIWTTIASRDEIRRAEIVGQKYDEIKKQLAKSEQIILCIHNLSLGKLKYAEGHYDDTIRCFSIALEVINGYPVQSYTEELNDAIYRFIIDEKIIEISKDSKMRMIAALYNSSHPYKKELLDYFNATKIMKSRKMSQQIRRK